FVDTCAPPHPHPCPTRRSSDLEQTETTAGRQPYDEIVVGAGAAGMMAAGTAARNGRRVLLLEKMEKSGRKVRITGKGRCNVTNADRKSTRLNSSHVSSSYAVFC